MLRSTIKTLTAAIVLISAGACDQPSDRVIGIDAKGAVLGVAFVDRNGNGLLDLPSDGPQQNVRIQLSTVSGGSPIASTLTNALGSFEFRNIPVGDYQVGVDPASIPDSLQLVKVDSSRVHVMANDSVGVLVTLSFPKVTIEEARTLPAGRRIFVEGVTLNNLTTFGDSTLHLADSTGAIRAIRVLAAGVNAGTRVRVLGSTELRDAQPTLADATVTQLASAQQPTPTVVNTAQAAQADAGQLDAALVQVVSAPIVGAVATAGGDYLVSVNDGSGLLEVLIDRSSGIPTGQLISGAQLTATGVLVTAGANKWQLKPRAAADLSVGFASATVSEARAMQVGRIVAIEGVALNSWLTFGDLTVHLADSTGTIRVLLTSTGNMLQGDRVRVLGTIATRDGQPVLASASGSVLGPGVIPPVDNVTTAQAKTANAGLLDAALVRVNNVAITATTAIGGDFVLTVNDGSGPADVVLDKDSGFTLAPFVVGAHLDVTGVLVTAAGGASWSLKPRQQSDLVVR